MSALHVANERRFFWGGWERYRPRTLYLSSELEVEDSVSLVDINSCDTRSVFFCAS